MLTGLNPDGQYLGPFLGLNDLLDPSRLGFRYAVEARNVILADQSIRPRPPHRHMGRVPNNSEITAMYAWAPPKDNYKPQILITTIAGHLHRMDLNGNFQTLTTGLSQLRLSADFVRWQDFVYILEGGTRIWKTDGLVGPQHTLQAGIEAPKLVQTGPNSGHVEFSANNHGIAPVHVYDYAVTFYDAANLVESNPVYSPITASIAAAGSLGSMDITFRMYTPPPANTNISVARIYRRNRTLGSVGWRLIGTSAITPGAAFVDSRAEADITQSSDVFGPFAPSRNGVPHSATCGCIWQGRMMLNRTDLPGRITFSPVNQPDYQHYVSDADADAIRVTGDADDRIRGLAVLGNQLIIGKRGRIWISSGQLAGPTNQTTATGALPLESAEQTWATETLIGPVNESGNGFFLGGEPVRILFAADSGVQMFDGTSAHSLTVTIPKLWARLMGVTPTDESRGRTVSFADDRRDGVLYVCVSPPGNQPSFPDNDVPTLAYHYRIDRYQGAGGWTTVDDGDLSGTQIGGVGANQLARITRVLSSSENKDPNEPNSDDRSAPVIFGFSEGVIARYIHDSQSGAHFPNDADDQAVPEWRYRTGAVELLRGKNALIHMVKWFTTKGSNLGAQGFLVSFRVHCDERSDQKTQDILFPRKIVQPIRRTCQYVSMEVSKGLGQGTGWDPSIGIVGWQIDHEWSGRR